MVSPTAWWCCGGVLNTALLILPAPPKCSLFVTSCIFLPKVCIGIVIFSHTYSFFVLCCSLGRLSRCEHSGRGSQVLSLSHPHCQAHRQGPLPLASLSGRF